MSSPAGHGDLLGEAAALSDCELRAACLDGDLTRVADAFLPMGLPETAAIRAAALRRSLRERAVAADATAAWVWGAAWRLAQPLTAYLRPGAHLAGVTHLEDGVAVHEVRLREDELLDLDGVAVTSPARTALDLARAPESRFDQAALARMLRIAGVSAVELEAEIAPRRRLLGRRSAIRRLQVLFTR